MPEDAGALLVRSGLIASEQLRIAREAQAGQGGTIGEHLVLAGFIEDEALTDFYRTRLMVPQVRPEQLANIPEALIAKIPADMASEFRCIPVACDRDRNLTLAMADPSTTHTVDEISFFTGHYVVRAVAMQSQIAWCLARYYGYITPLGERLLGGAGRSRAADRLPLPANPAMDGRALAVQGSRAAGASAGHAGVRPASGQQTSSPAQAAAQPAPQPRRARPSTMPGSHGQGDSDDSDSPVPVAIESDRPSPRPMPYPYLPPEHEQRVISFLREDTAPTGPMRVLRRPVTQPPELAARAGEVEIQTGPVPLFDESLPAVMISPTLQIGIESQPVYIDQLGLGEDALDLLAPEPTPLPLPEPVPGELAGELAGQPGPEPATGLEPAAHGAPPAVPAGDDEGWPLDDLADDLADGFADGLADSFVGRLAEGRADSMDDGLASSFAEGLDDGEPSAADAVSAPIPRPTAVSAPIVAPPPVSAAVPAPPDWAMSEPLPGTGDDRETNAGPDSDAEPDADAERAAGVVLLERPKSERRRHRRTHIGLGIPTSTLSRLTRAAAESAAGSNSKSSPAVDPAAPQVTTSAWAWPARPAEQMTAVSEPPQTPTTPATGVVQAMGVTPVMPWTPAAQQGAGQPGTSDQPADRGMSPAAGIPDRPTDQPSAPVPYSEPWAWSTRELPDSIQDAARAAAEGYLDSYGQAPGSEPVGTLDGQAVPSIIEDDKAALRALEASAAARAVVQTPPVTIRYDDDPDDERWGPPGTTIPPQLLGPLPQHDLDSGPEPIPLIAEHIGDDFDDEDVDRLMNAGFSPTGQVAGRGAGRGQQRAGAAPVHGAAGHAPVTDSGDIRIVESAPLRGERGEVATTSRAVPASGPSLSFHSSEVMTPEIMHELEDSSLRLVEILRELDQADSRNQVIDTLIEHLAESHARVAFFVVKAGELTTWKQRMGEGPIEKRDGIKLSLDEPSTFQDIVGTRLPFRGPLTDPVSRAFIAAALDYSAGEMLGLPVSVRGRVVGILYGDNNIKRVFEQHLAVVTRAAGVALERILRAKKGA